MTRKDTLVAVCLALLTLAVWAPGLGGGFQFDDWNVIVNEPQVQSLHAWWHSMPGIRPVLKLTYALNNEWGSGAVGFRAVNIVLHIANTVLVLWILLAFARQRLTSDDPATTAIHGRLAAAIAALLFALHPVQSDAVSYISGRSSVLSAFFSLLALWLWQRRALRVASEPLLRRWRINWPALLAFALALGSKESALALPFALALMWYAARPAERQAGGQPFAELGRIMAPFMLLTAFAVVAAAATTPYPRLIALASEGRSLSGNLLTQANGVSYLLGQILLIRPANADPALPYVASLNLPTALRGAMLLTIMVMGWRLLRRHPAVAFGVLWFFVWLAPTNSFLPRLDAVFDRQVYVAMIGPAWLLGWGIASLAARPLRGVAVAAVATLAAYLGTQTLSRHAVYADEISFWRDVTLKSPNSSRAANNLAMAYASACREQEALAEFARAARLDPADPYAPINRALLQRGELPLSGTPCERREIR
ncbi:MAG: hypothetical protein KDI32_14645 [Pseudomonadales bacterium]|nr:hypothetical protein [Pseudomonadales bacterium]